MKTIRTISVLGLLSLSSTLLAATGGTITFVGRIAPSPCEMTRTTNPTGNQATVKVTGCDVPVTIHATTSSALLPISRNNAEGTQIGKATLAGYKLAGENQPSYFNISTPKGKQPRQVIISYH
ncbi:hypothetical protein HZU77_011230 [Neisseriaceae bacterium TC5R-5]|nr:hypothetical protein [Neisseriaceae bacterium TC5R-5]